MATSAQLPAEEHMTREDHRCSPPRAANHAHLKNLKKGVERKDRHPSTGINPSPKKSGRGGRFTWEGSSHADDYAASYDLNNALDKNDPNYVDEEEEEIHAAAEIEGKKECADAPPKAAPDATTATVAATA
ncbi:hypothetical protein SELMODRAFT_405387 [Selaginella moellendorffii]|uniref:Hyaluronan/mRNA-binding protein domain-containing protein n=1 Tax=Selaginella moellendorffii TaxID=88036 RepID=D8QX67_SELML|nr:uncharacterized protein LOC9655483 [Selaginella moellendorffii]EFJ35355.1 hypothetical protein SELMODRAFT_405387 [Selaginella moellendorffii]|eukprot:XP_002963484.1 uncharacterized protein LOC9655483 [Selaginella moellendorffii]